MPARRRELLHVEKLVEGLRRLRQGETRASVCASLKAYDLASAFDKHGQLLPRQAHMRAAAVHDKLESLQQGGGDGAAVVARLFDEIGRHREMALTRTATAMRILMEASELLRGPRAPTIVRAVEAVHAKFDTQYSKVSFEKALRATGELQCETFSFAKAIVNDARWLRDHGDDAHKELSDQWERFVADQRPRAVPVPRRPRPAFGIERRTRFVHALIEGLRRMQSGETFSAAALQSATLKRVFKSDGSFRPYGERFLAEVRSMPGGAALADQLVRESELALLSPHGEMARAIHAVAAIAHGIARIKEGQNKQQVEEELRAGAAAGLYGGVVHSKILHCAVRADGHSFMPGPHASALAKKVARLNPENADHRKALDALRDAIRKNHPQPEIFDSTDPLEDLLRLAGEDGRTKDRTRTSGPVGSASTPSPGVGPSHGASGAQPSDENASDEDLEAVPTLDSSARTTTSSGDDDAGGADEPLDERAALHLELFGSSPEPASPPLREPPAGPSTAPVSLMSLRAALAGGTLAIKAE